jgi:hypothetical protein
MELVSVLAGQPWSDHPACTDPTLATIARVVNDELSDPARQTLAQLAAELVGRTGDPARLAPALVHRCLPMAEAHLGAPAAPAPDPAAAAGVRSTTTTRRELR